MSESDRFEHEIDVKKEIARLSESYRVRKQLGMSSISHLRLIQKPEVSPTTELANQLKHEVIGQDNAIDSVITALNRESLRDDEKPYCSLLFLGPTGVGKTETARALDRNLHGKSSRLVRIDCSEYQREHQIAALIGAPPGYIGHSQEPRLSPSVVQGEKVIILFDEIEKASGALHKLLLQILEEGQLSMQNSKIKTDFTKSIIIMTSNLGAREMNARIDDNPVGFLPVKPEERAESKSKQSINKLVMDEVKNTLPPELIGRIDECVIFDRLDDDKLSLVLDRHIEKSNKRFKNKGIQLHATDRFREAFIENDPERKQYGGRRIVKKFDNTVVSRLSEYVSAGAIPRGSDVYVVLREGRLKQDDTFDFDFYASDNDELREHYETVESAKSKTQTALVKADGVKVPDPFKAVVSYNGSTVIKPSN